jgi:hypothetical protein
MKRGSVGANQHFGRNLLVSVNIEGQRFVNTRARDVKLRVTTGWDAL